MSPPELSLIIPAFNEGDVITACLERSCAVLADLGVPCEILIVDDGSMDHTVAAVDAFRQTLEPGAPELVTVQLSRNFGKEAAICAGLDACRGAAAIVMDADLQHPPERIPEMVERWRQGAEVVEAVKVKRGREPLIDRLGSWLFYRLLGRLTGTQLEGASDFKLLSRRALEKWRQFGESETFFRGLVPWIGLRRAQISFEVPSRPAGSSRWSTVQRLRLALFALTSFSSLPLQLVTVAGLGLFAITTVFALQALYQKWQGVAVEGFTTVILLISFIGSTIMISLGIIGLYIARIYNEIKRRPRYLVAQRSDEPRR